MLSTNTWSGVDGKAGEDAVSAAVDKHRRPAIGDTTATGHAAESAAASEGDGARAVQTGEITRL